MIQWIVYPKSSKPTDFVLSVVQAFEKVANEIDSEQYDLSSNDVLRVAAPCLTALGFAVEQGKKTDDKIPIPVLFGMGGKVEKSFDADAYHAGERFVLEVEAGRAVANNQFLKDLFQACMMHDVDYLAVAVRNTYRESKDFERVMKFFDTLYASNRLSLPLKGILILGY